MDMSIGHWIREVKNGRRPGYALVISGPKGCGKGLLSRALAEGCGRPLFDAGRIWPTQINERVVRYADKYAAFSDGVKDAVTDPSGPLGVIVETHTEFSAPADNRRFLVVNLPRVCHPEQRNGGKILARALTSWPDYATRAEVPRLDDVAGAAVVNFYDGDMFVQKMLAVGPLHVGDRVTRDEWQEWRPANSKPVAPPRGRPFLKPEVNSALRAIAENLQHEMGRRQAGVHAHGYDKLAHVLQRAFDQSARGKGKDRHTTHDGHAFEDQPICELQRMYGHGYAYGQVGKKMEEAQRLPRDQAVAELLGGIVYLAAAIVVMEEGEDNE